MYDIRLIRIFPPLVDALMRSLGKFGSSLDFAHDSSGITVRITESPEKSHHSIAASSATSVHPFVIWRIQRSDRFSTSGSIDLARSKSADDLSN